ncbi:MAG: hypothetical protein EOM18_00665 [Clostridia bacterium]|nr:hypothetical protein [Clostridia bacterium]
MIKQAEEFDFLFLLDAYNEMNDYLLPDGQTVYIHVINSLSEVLELGNTHFIISVREKMQLFNGKKENYKKLRDSLITLELQKLTSAQIENYLRIDDADNIPEFHKELLSNPFSIIMYKDIFDKDQDLAMGLETKYQLMETYFENFEIHDMDDRIDNIAEVRRYIIRNVLPQMGFYIEMALMEKKRNEFMRLDFAELMENTLMALPYNISRDIVRRVMKMMNIVDENLQFSHQLIRDYFAFKGLMKMDDILEDRSKDITNFFELLDENICYIREKGDDFIRRSKFLDAAEFIYGYFSDPGELVDFLVRNGVDENDVLEYVEHFYRNLAGIYDDLRQKKEAYEIGWKAVSLLEKIHISEYDHAQEYNYLYYSVNKYGDKDPLCLLEKAYLYLEKIPEKQKKSLPYRELAARICSNYGSYYCSIYKKDLTKAIGYHKQALENRLEIKKILNNKKTSEEINGYRMKASLDCAASYRTLMSDYYHMKRYDLAYGMYKEALKDVTGCEYISEVNKEKLSNIPLVLITFVMGSEVPLLEQREDFALTTEIEKELAVQIEYVYQRANESSRKDTAILKELKKNLLNLSKVETCAEDLKKIVAKHLEILE